MNTTTAFDAQTIQDIIKRASSSTYENWWERVTVSGFCASPIHLTQTSSIGNRLLFARCKNRRFAVCPSCSDLYAGDTWHLVHAGLGGGNGIPETISHHPIVFVTLTAPSFGAVHASNKHSAVAKRCHPERKRLCCEHGNALSCGVVHRMGDETAGHPLCAHCYDYTGHALFTWHAPELWSRFARNLRRLVNRHLRDMGENPGAVKVSFVKIVEMQQRCVPHYHAIIRLDKIATSTNKVPVPPATTMTAETLSVLARQAANMTQLDVGGVGGEIVTLRFGQQIDTQPLTTSNADTDGVELARKISGYLAKYVTKSVTDFGLAPRRISPTAIDRLEVDDHIRRLLHTIAVLAVFPERSDMLNWLHTLGYRGHVTTKSRRYSVTMTELRAKRTAHNNQPVSVETEPSSESEGAEWEYAGAGHKNSGERLLAVTAAHNAREARWAARQLADNRKGA